MDKLVEQSISTIFAANNQLKLSIDSDILRTLLAPTANEEKRNLKQYTQYLQTLLNSDDLMILKGKFGLYQVTIDNLVFGLELSQQESQVIRGLQTQAKNSTDVIHTFVTLQLAIQRLLRKIYAGINNRYVLQIAPLRTTQYDYFKNNEEEFFPHFDIYFEIQAMGLQSDGKPSLNKFKKNEQENHILAVEISAQTATINMHRILENRFSEDEKLLSALDKIIINLYRNFFTRKYNQQPEATKITKAEFFSKIVSELEQLNTALPKEFFGTMNIIKEKLKQLQQQLSEEDVFDEKNPWIYEILIREANEFENNQYQPYFAVDCYEQVPGSSNHGELLATYVMIDHPLAIDQVEILLNDNV